MTEVKSNLSLSEDLSLCFSGCSCFLLTVCDFVVSVFLMLINLLFDHFNWSYLSEFVASDFSQVFFFCVILINNFMIQLFCFQTLQITDRFWTNE